MTSMTDTRAGGFIDHFSHDAAGYAAYRPVYPAELFDWLAERAPAREMAWDCATGNGQAALGLAARFERVLATDASRQQIAHARPHARVEYRVASAEQSGLPAAAFDLVSVAQAAHWFDLPRFYAEARRVLRPGGVLALYGYERLQVNPAVDAVVDRLYRQELEGFWPPQRRHVEAAYRDLPFPFREMDTPSFSMTAQWDLSALLGYLASWSAVKRYREHHGRDPVQSLRPALEQAWGSPRTRRTIKWRIFLRVGQV